MHALPINAPEAITRVAAHEDILGNIQVGEKHRFLVNNSDAKGLGLCRRTQFYHLTTNFHHPRVRSVDTCQDFHQGTLSRPVFSNKRVYFTWIQAEIHFA